MELYLWIKLLHILSATVLFGTGIGIAFFMLKAHLADSHEVMIVTTRHVVLADWLFTMPSVFIQFSTGIWLTAQSSIPFGSVWFLAVISLFGFIGLCWLPVIWIQIRIKEMLNEGAKDAEYQKLMRLWILLGIPAFLSILVIFYLMVSKTGMGIIIL